MPKQKFVWDDPFLLNEQLSSEERMVRDAARAYCQDKLIWYVALVARRGVFGDIDSPGDLLD